MTKEWIGLVAQAEKEEILRLHERRTALLELFLTLDSPYLSEDAKQNLGDRIIEDFVRTSSLFERWWRETGRKYNWPSKEHGKWMIDFETNEVYYQPSGADSPGPDEPLPLAPGTGWPFAQPQYEPELSCQRTEPLPRPGRSG